EVLLISFREDPARVKRTAAERGYVAPVLLDESGEVTGKLYGGWGPPTAYLIGRQGQLVGRLVGPHDWSTPVGEVGGGRPPDPVELPRDLSGLVEEDGGDVTTLGGRALHARGVFPKADQQDLEPLCPKILVQPVDGRQLLPAVGSPGRPEEDEHDLAAQVGKAHGLPLEVGECERGRGLGRRIRDRADRREVRLRRGRGSHEERHGQARERDARPHAPTDRSNRHAPLHGGACYQVHPSSPRINL